MFPELISKKLGDIYEDRFGEPIQNAHDAKADTLALQKLFHRDLQSLFDMKETRLANVTTYTASNAPIIELRGIGPYTKKHVIRLLENSEPTVGDLRQYCAVMSVQEIEFMIRTRLKCTKETFLFSILCEITQHPSPIALFNTCFPNVTAQFPGLSKESIQTLSSLGIASPEQLKRYYLYVLEESADKWDILLKTLECNSFRVSLLMRGL